MVPTCICIIQCSPLNSNLNIQAFSFEFVISEFELCGLHLIIPYSGRFPTIRYYNIFTFVYIISIILRKCCIILQQNGRISASDSSDMNGCMSESRSAGLTKENGRSGSSNQRSQRKACNHRCFNKNVYPLIY